MWTFNSRILWKEPYVVYSKILNGTRKIKIGPMVTNPATRDITVTASVFATLNEMYGNRTVIGIGRGDSAVSVTNGKPVIVADSRPAVIDIKAWSMASRSTTRNPPCACLGPADSAYSNQFAEAANAALQAEGVDTTGEGFTPITVELREGGE